jgi:H+/Cl- antiporter ClcA
MTIVLHDLILFGLIAVIAILWLRSYNQNDRLSGLEELIAAFMEFMDEADE